MDKFAKDYIAIINIKHKKFVDNIKNQCFFYEENNPINKKINNIFDIILRF